MLETQLRQGTDPHKSTYLSHHTSISLKRNTSLRYRQPFAIFFRILPKQSFSLSLSDTGPPTFVFVTRHTSPPENTCVFGWGNSYFTIARIMTTTTTATLHVLLQQEQHYWTPSSPSHTECRSAMAAWCNQCVDFCQFGREPVEITLNYVDRFLATPAGAAALDTSSTTARSIYQLTTMAALYAAIKIHQPEALSSSTMAALSRGRYSVGQIEEMERSILVALEWRMHPVTALSFVREYLLQLSLHLDFLDGFATTPLEPQQPQNKTSTTLHSTVMELAKLQTELALRDASLRNAPPSVIAYGALLNALESCGSTISAKNLHDIRQWLAPAIGRSENDPFLLSTQRRLYASVVQASACGSSKGDSTSTTTSGKNNENPCSCSSNASSSSPPRRRPFVSCTNGGNQHHDDDKQVIKQHRTSSASTSPRAAAGV